MTAARVDHAATLLENGEVLLAGGEIYDPALDNFTVTGGLNAPRSGHTATRLKDGDILIVGGADGAGRRSTSAEIFDRRSATFTREEQGGTGEQVQPLSYGFWYSKGGAVMCRVAPKAARALKQHVRQITRRSGWRSPRTVVAELRKYLPGWKEYFRLADTPKVFADYDKWIRHRLRALQLKQWRRSPKVYAEMRRLGLPDQAAANAAAVHQRWWSRAAKLVQLGLTTRYYDRLDLPINLNLSNRRMRTRMSGGVAGE